MTRSDLDALEGVCQRISLNIPDSCPWRWDEQFNLALTVVDRQDEIMVELPLTLEFAHQWRFDTIDDADAALRDFLNSGFGVVPGQKVFSTDDVNGIILFAVWWPWGDEARISLRLGLVPLADASLAEDEAKTLLCRWLKVA